jgi:hypothetical protein
MQFFLWGGLASGSTTGIGRIAAGPVPQVPPSTTSRVVPVLVVVRTVVLMSTTSTLSSMLQSLLQESKLHLSHFSHLHY